MPDKVILSSDDVRRALVRIAHEIVERNRGVDGLVLIGILTRGLPLARRIAEEIKAFEQVEIPVGTLEIALYRDDIAQGLSHRLKKTDIPSDLNGKRVVLVDDVLYTGRSIRAAMDAIMDFGRPRLVQLAVLVDRGHRELPIRADYVGKNVPTSVDETVRVRLTEVDNAEEVTIVQRQGVEASAKGSGGDL